MSFTPQASLLTPPLAGIAHRIVQALKAGTPKIAAFKYELRHTLYPMLTLAVTQQSKDTDHDRNEKQALRQQLSYARTKARLIAVYLSLINMDLRAEKACLDAMECDSLLIEEFGEIGEKMVRAMMVRAAETFLTESGALVSQDEPITSAKEQQQRVVTSLRTLQVTPMRLLNDLAQAEALIERFWLLEEQIAS